MTQVEKMGYKVILGVCLWIGGTYVLIKLLGEFFLIPILVVVGWVILLAYTLKFFAAVKKESDKRKTY